MLRKLCGASFVALEEEDWTAAVSRFCSTSLSACICACGVCVCLCHGTAKKHEYVPYLSCQSQRQPQRSANTGRDERRPESLSFRRGATRCLGWRGGTRGPRDGHAMLVTAVVKSVLICYVSVLEDYAHCHCAVISITRDRCWGRMCRVGEFVPEESLMSVQNPALQKSRAY